MTLAWIVSWACISIGCICGPPEPNRGMAFSTRSSLIGCAVRYALNGSYPNIERMIIIEFLNHQSKLQALINPRFLLSECSLDHQNIENLDGLTIPGFWSRPTRCPSESTLSLKNNNLRHVRGLRARFGPTSMDLSGNQIREFQSFQLILPPLHPFTHLVHLILDDNKITSNTLRNHFNFHSLLSLKTLSLRNNCITTLYGVHFPVLQSLDLSFNLISNLSNFTVKVMDLILGHNQMYPEILRTFSMEQSEIHTLNLMNNKLYDLSSLHFPDGLRILNLERNPIRRCYEFHHSRTLQQLYLSNTGITEIELKSILPPGSLLELSTLNLTNNRIRSIDGIHFPPNLKQLFLGRNKIRNLKEPAFPERLTHLYLGHNLLRNNRKNRMNVKFPSRLIHLELQNNAIHSLRGVALPNDLMYLYLDNNGITDLMLYKMQFYIPQRLSVLSLRCNRLSSLFSLRMATRIRAELVSLDGNALRSGCVCSKSKEKRDSMRRLSALRIVNRCGVIVLSLNDTEVIDVRR